MSAKELPPNNVRKRPIRKTAKVFCRFDAADAIRLDAAADKLVKTRSEVIRIGTLRFVDETLGEAA